MAQSDRFYFWRAFYDALMTLDTDEQRGEFVRGMCQWAFDGEMPEFTDKILAFGFTNIRDQLTESVDIGRAARETGKLGGRPKKTTPKTTPKTGPKRGRERGPETEGKGTDRKGSDLPPTGEGVAAAADAAPPAPMDDGIVLPPMPEGWE